MKWELTEKRKAAIQAAIKNLESVLEKEKVSYKEVLNAIDNIKRMML